MNLLTNAISGERITLYVLVVICLIGLIITAILMVVNYFKKKKKKIIIEPTTTKALEHKSKTQLDENELRTKVLSDVSGMSEKEIQKYIEDHFDEYITKDTISKIEEVKEESISKIEEAAKAKIIDAMEDVVTDVILQTKNDIEIDDDLVGRFIGKDGMNIKTIEKITECQVSIVDKKFIRVSSFNSLKKEICTRLIHKLIKAKTFDRNRIEKNYQSICKELDEELINIGKKTLNDLEITGINQGIYKYIGRLYYRSSYSQNVLTHAIECAKLAASIAESLSCDVQIAKQCAFFHDIGKSVDYEEDGNHVKSGVELAKKYGLSKYVINAIESHHDEEECKYIYSRINKIVDKISSSRPGVRLDSNEALTIRSEEIERLSKEIHGVKKAYVIRGGKEIIIIVDDSLSDDKFKKIGLKIKDIIKKNNNVNYMDIKVTVMKEQIYSV